MPKVKPEFPAYDLTSKNGYEGILRDNAIIPLGLRADDQTVVDSCTEDIERYSIPWSYVDPEVIRIVMNDFLKTRPHYAGRVKVPRSDIHTPCLELALGYGQGVLLSATPLDPGALGPYYFIFDATKLLQEGMVQIVDNTFENAFTDQLSKLRQQHPDFFQQEGLVDRIKELANKVHQETETKSLEEGTGWYFFPGILPLEWAVDYGIYKRPGVWKAPVAKSLFH